MRTTRPKPAESPAAGAETLPLAAPSGHPQAAIVAPWSGKLIAVDLELAPMLEHLWRAGIETMHSCCGGDPGQTGACIYGYVVVIGRDSMRRCLEAVIGGTEIPLDSIDRDPAWSGWASGNLKPLPEQGLSDDTGHCLYWPSRMTSAVARAVIANLDRPQLTAPRRRAVDRLLAQMDRALELERQLAAERLASV